MKALLAFGACAAALVILFTFSTIHNVAHTVAAQSAPASIDGTYELEYRELPDGKQMRPPEVIGAMNFINGRRNFNVYWTDNGKPVAISTISKYTFSPTEYTEQNIYTMMNDQTTGKPPTFDTSSTTGKSPVKIDGEKISFKLPLHNEPDLVFDAKGFTATEAAAFVDHWKKVE
jgi:hypothetical protein